VLGLQANAPMLGSILTYMFEQWGKCETQILFSEMNIYLYKMIFQNYFKTIKEGVEMKQNCPAVDNYLNKVMRRERK
jgi:hypothetical protein